MSDLGLEAIRGLAPAVAGGLKRGADAAWPRAKVNTSAGMCSVLVHTSFESARSPWLELEAQGHLTPYQSFDFLHAWYLALGTHECSQPRIVEGRLPDGRLAFVWPFGICAWHGLPVLGWLGGKHANYNLGIYSPHALSAMAPGDWRNLLRAATRLAGADAAVLLNQPERFETLSNPLLETRSLASASDCYAARLEPDYEKLMERLRNRGSRKKIRRNIRRLEETAGPVSLQKATTLTQIIDTLGALRAHKGQLDPSRPDRHIFADARVIGFLTTAARAVSQARAPAIEIYALKAGANIVATFGGAVSAKRAAGTFISIDAQDFGNCAPGEVLIAKLLEEFSTRGIETFDLGVGEAEYKSRWCHEVETLFDTILPATARGRILTAPVMHAALRAKAAVKHSPWLLAIARKTGLQSATGNLPAA